MQSAESSPSTLGYYIGSSPSKSLTTDVSWILASTHKLGFLKMTLHLTAPPHNNLAHNICNPPPPTPQSTPAAPIVQKSPHLCANTRLHPDLCLLHSSRTYPTTSHHHLDLTPISQTDLTSTRLGDICRDRLGCF